MYNRKPILPIDVKHDHSATKALDPNEPFDMDTFQAVLDSTSAIREKIFTKVEQNISQAQQKQKRDYDRRHQSSNVISVGDKVLLKNNKRNDRKGGKFTFKWLGPFVVKALSPKGLATLQNLKSGKALKNKYNKVQLKHYVDGNEVIVDQSNISEEKPIIHEPNDEKPAHTTNDEKLPVLLEHEDIDINKKSFFSLLPDELIEEILLASLKSSSHVNETCQNIMGTCKKFRLIIKEKGKTMLPHIYVNPDDVFKNMPLHNGKIKISVQKLRKCFGENSSLLLRLSEIIDNGKWKSARLLLLKAKRKSWYIIDRIYWKGRKCDMPVIHIDDEKDAVDAKDEEFWLRNDLYYLKMKEKQILMSDKAWLNDNIQKWSNLTNSTKSTKIKVVEYSEYDQVSRI
jgi:hypothetical protein